MNKVREALPRVSTSLSGRDLSDQGSFWEDKSFLNMAQEWAGAGRELDPCRRWTLACSGTEYAMRYILTFRKKERKKETRTALVAQT